MAVPPRARRATKPKTGKPAIYHPQELAFYSGNPLIEALPPLHSEADAKRLLAHEPQRDASYRDLPDHLRYHALLDYSKVFVPLPYHLALDQQLAGIIYAGYAERNPLVPGHWPRTREKLEALLQTLAHRLQSEGHATPRMTLIGLSGTGKTTSLRRILRPYDQVLNHSRYHGRLFTHRQVVWLHLQCPRNGALTVLVRSFFQELDRALGSQYYDLYVERSRRPVEAFIPDMANLAALHSLGVLVIDEIQNLVGARGIDAIELLNFLVELDETMGIPIILVGTPEAQEVLGARFRRARRAGGVGPVDWDRLAKDDEWSQFVTKLWPYQVIRGATDSPTPELSAALYDASQGIIDIAMKMFLLAQVHSIAAGDETLSEEMFRTASTVSLRMVQPYLDALRRNDVPRLKTFRDVYLGPLTPDDLVRAHDVHGSIAGFAASRTSRKRPYGSASYQAPDATPSVTRMKMNQAGGQTTDMSDARQPAAQDEDAPLLVRLFDDSRRERVTIYSALRKAGFIASAMDYLEGRTG